MHKAHSEFRARPQQPGIDKRRPVIDINTSRNPAAGQRRLQRGTQPDSVLGEPETVPADQPGMIIEEGEQIGLSPTDPRPV